MLTFKTCGGSNFLICGESPNVTIQMETIEQYFHMVLFIMVYEVVLTFEFVDETLVCDHSNESY